MTKKIPQLIISIIFILGYFYNLNILMTGGAKIDAGLEDFVKILLTILTVAIPIIIQFWLGSSSGSKDKDGAGK